LQGPLPNFLGCSLDRLPFASAIKCHQTSTCNSAGGWVVCWVLSTPHPGHPAAGRCDRVVPVLPLLLCTRPARARPSVGGQSPPPALPLRASSRGVALPGAGALAGCRTPIQPACFTKAAAPKSKPMRVMHLVALCTGWPKLLPSPNEVARDGVWACFRRPRIRKPTGAFHWLFHAPHLKSQITSLALTRGRDVSPPTSSVVMTS
jgi:hypothetical protein